jgi:putative DNA primase/helicase
LNLNNISFDLESDLLCQLTTERLVGLRRLGISDLISCDCTGTTIFANGNNIHVVGDLVRRTLTCHLDAKLEAPETRSFAFDPVVRVKADRGRYLNAAFTIARAYLAAGSPKVHDQKFNGFDEWSKMVRYPLLWLGCKDPVASKQDARNLDPQRQALAALLDAIELSVGIGEWFTAAELTKLALETNPHDFNRARPELFEALSEDGRSISNKMVGQRLAKARDRVSHERRIECKPDKHGNRYRLVVTDGAVKEPIVKEPNSVEEDDLPF